MSKIVNVTFYFQIKKKKKLEKQLIAACVNFITALNNDKKN